MIKLLNRIFDLLEKLHQQIKLAIKRKKIEEFKEDVKADDILSVKNKFDNRD